MTMTVLELSTEIQEELADAIPCDYMDCNQCQGLPARWIVWLSMCPHCKVAEGSRFMCDACKGYRIDAEEGTAVYCPGCEFVWAPARLAYSRVEAINPS